MKRIYLIADVHLNQINQYNTDNFLKFLTIFGNSDAEKLIILGDLFSNWIGIDDILTDFQKRIIIEIKSAKKKREIVFLYGNRDYFVDELCESPFDYVMEKFIIEKDGEKILFEHGEKINDEDRKYLMWSLITRTGFVKAFIKSLPSNFVKKLAKKLEESLSKTNYENKIAIPFDKIRNYCKVLKEDNFTHIFLGHFHKDVELEVEGIKVFLLEPFFEKGCYIVIDENLKIEKKFVKTFF